MGCIKLSILETNLKITELWADPTKKNLTSKKSSFKGCRDYVFGYNAGSEKDDEITGETGTHFTTYFREFDTRTLQPWSSDPVFQPWQSPYSYMDGNPILFNDPRGDNADWYVNGKTGEVMYDEDEHSEKLTILDEDNNVVAVWNNIGENNMFGEEVAREQGSQSAYGSKDAEQFMNKQGYKLAISDEIVNITKYEYYYTDADGAVRTVSSQSITDRETDSKNVTYTSNKNVISKTNSEYIGGTIRRHHGSWYEETNRYKQSYQYGETPEKILNENKKQDIMNTFLKDFIQPILEMYLENKHK